jgi:hypothetical protein
MLHTMCHNAHAVEEGLRHMSMSADTRGVGLRCPLSPPLTVHMAPHNMPIARSLTLRSLLSGAAPLYARKDGDAGDDELRACARRSGIECLDHMFCRRHLRRRGICRTLCRTCSRPFEHADGKSMSQDRHSMCALQHLPFTLRVLSDTSTLQ